MHTNVSDTGDNRTHLIFSRAGGSHLLRYSGLAIEADYGGALKCLAYGNLQLVQNSGKKKTNYLDF